MAASPQDAYEEMIKGIWRDNPVFVQVLGMCPMLAVSNSAVNALAMGLATAFVLIASSLLVSLFRRVIPKQVRISCFVLIIATFVTVADFTLQALAPAIHKELGAFVPLIVANCMILGRQEAFAARHAPKLAVADAAGMAGGFLLALFSLGTIREILGSGTFLGLPVFGDTFQPWVVMLLPPGGFITLGLLLLVFNWVTQRIERASGALAPSETSASSR
jgi:electron transport complex protein RnfE